VDNWHWLGGVREYAAFRAKERDDFWTDPQLFDDFKKTVEFVINRKNTFTGVRYRDDKAILAWETGNELRGPREWSWKVAAYVKTMDTNHLVLDGWDSRLLTEEAFQNPNVDFVQTHHYERNPRDMVEHVRQSARLARGKKPYIVGEFGFISTEGVRAVIDAIMEEGVVGGMTWSLRFHNRDGGFYWHHEPSGGDLFKAYHWPGFHSGINYDEAGFLQLIRDKAFAIQGMEALPLQVPAPPKLLSFSDVSQIAWQGSADASSYNVERSESPNGQWTVAGREVSDAVYQYRPAFNDAGVEKGRLYYYRVLARNYSGISEPSNVVGPVKVSHKTIVDELENNSKFFSSQGELAFLENEARKFKEDSHRLRGEKGSHVIYYAPENITSWKIFSFSGADTTHFRFSTSKDGKTFSDLVHDRKNYFTGGGDYRYLQPILYFKDTMQTPGQYLKVEFAADVQIARVEIKY
jgi:hypothetical protein